MTFIEFTRLLGIKLTAGQRVLCAVCFDGVQPSEFEGADRDVARQLFGAVDYVDPALLLVVLWLKGARIGGTWLAALRALHLAYTIDLSSLAPGELAFVLLVGPDTRLPGQALRYAAGAVQSTHELAGTLVGTPTTESMRIRRDDEREVTFEILPATRGGSAVRGRSLVAAVMTEASHFRDRDFVVNDHDVFRAIVPRVLPGGQAIIESTPWGEQGLVYDLFDQNHGKPTSAVVAHCPTLLLRDDKRTRAIVSREYARDSLNADREFGAQFMSGGASNFFDPFTIARAFDSTLLPFAANGDIA